jgi:hypothetical protein
VALATAGVVVVVGGVASLAGGGVLLARGIRRNRAFRAWKRDHRLSVAPTAAAGHVGAAASFRF